MPGASCWSGRTAALMKTQALEELPFSADRKCGLGNSWRWPRSSDSSGLKRLSCGADTPFHPCGGFPEQHARSSPLHDGFSAPRRKDRSIDVKLVSESRMAE